MRLDAACFCFSLESSPFCFRLLLSISQCRDMTGPDRFKRSADSEENGLRLKGFNRKGKATWKSSTKGLQQLNLWPCRKDSPTHGDRDSSLCAVNWTIWAEHWYFNTEWGVKALSKQRALQIGMFDSFLGSTFFLRTCDLSALVRKLNCKKNKINSPELAKKKKIGKNSVLLSL